jgi:hypothetical protein
MIYSEAKEDPNDEAECNCGHSYASHTDKNPRLNVRACLSEYYDWMNNKHACTCTGFTLAEIVNECYIK